MGIFTTSLQSLILASFSRVLGAVYTLWRFNRIFFGLPKARSRKYNVDLVWKERLLFSILISIIFWRGIRPDFFIRQIGRASCRERV
jgi:NADH:ubiquinone oxidoreductase subunit 4 (subunit M)